MRDAVSSNISHQQKARGSKIATAAPQVMKQCLHECCLLDTELSSKSASHVLTSIFSKNSKTCCMQAGLPQEVQNTAYLITNALDMHTTVLAQISRA